VLNNEHAALEEWFKEVLKLLEVERYRLRPREDSADAAQPIFEAFDLGPTVKIVRQELGPSHPVTTLISETGKKFRKFFLDC